MNLGDTEREQIVAAYATGADVGDISRQYGLTRDDVEMIVAADADGDVAPITHPTPQRRRAPAPIVAAMLIVALYGLVQIAASATNPDLGGPAFRAGVSVVGLLFYGLIAVGIWRGVRAAQWVAALGGALAVVAGVVLTDSLNVVAVAAGALLVGLLFVPVQSRDWFAGR
ncbi:hypothetical protein [Micromonospora sp. DT229]|uniref:hypothetical protein n=1 Tax=Micromonospora sp. DT229 TaxID=3393430 RepID=UPI003CF15803